MDVKSKWQNYKSCFVPLCKSTTVETPHKHFLTVPKNPLRRKAWIKAVRRDERTQKLSLTSTMFCCEDHFNMEEDIENWLRFCMVGGYLHVKSHVVPNRFDCQPGRAASTSAAVKRRDAKSEKRKSAQLVSEILNSSNKDEENVPCPEIEESAIDVHHATSSHTVDLQPCNELSLLATLPVEISTRPNSINTREIGVQARVSYRSKSTMSTPMLLGCVSSVQTSPIKIATRPTYCDAQVSPIKSLQTKQPRLFVETIFTDSSSDESTNQEPIPSTSKPTSETVFIPSNSSDSDDSLLNEVEEDRIKNVSLERTRYLSKEHSMLYLGLPNDCFYVVSLLSKSISPSYRGRWLSAEDIVMLVLRKIRLNESFQVIANEFGISKSHATRLFADYVSKIAEYVLELIVWPSKENILRQLPVSFQARYFNVQSIIDCFEIEIEKPTNALHQSLTWSDYKKCNTLKYLVSSTPDGIINFISEGYGGRVSDMILLEDSGYLKKLSPGMDVMADRGFKHVEQALQQKQCRLVRPPSVSDGKKLSEADCKETKRIASLRIHIERVIRRLREFQLLLPHACVDVHILGKIDSCVYIAAGLVNLQPPLIK